MPAINSPSASILSDADLNELTITIHNIILYKYRDIFDLINIIIIIINNITESITYPAIMVLWVDKAAYLDIINELPMNIYIKCVNINNMIMYTLPAHCLIRYEWIIRHNKAKVIEI